MAEALSAAIKRDYQVLPRKTKIIWELEGILQWYVSPYSLYGGGDFIPTYKIDVLSYPELYDLYEEICEAKKTKCNGS